jgi:hypothetical protein
MNNTGSPAEAATGSTEPAVTDQRIPWSVLGIAGVVLVIVLVLGFQLVSILYALIALPAPPLPPDLTEAQHTNLTHGSDSWEYTTSAAPDTLVSFFREQGGQCVEVMLPQSDIVGAFERPGHRCSAVAQASIFNWRWQAEILALSGQTRLRLTRVVFWAGDAPTDVPLVESTPMRDN